jgi:hypothetical protein
MKANLKKELVGAETSAKKAKKIRKVTKAETKLLKGGGIRPCVRPRHSAY